MLRTPPASHSIVPTVVLAGVAPVVLALLVDWVRIGTSLHEPLHAVVEAGGSCMALASSGFSGCV
jgi:hypothetical protein